MVEFAPVLIPLWFLLIVSIPLFWIDIKEHRLPNRLTYPSIALSLLGTLGAAAVFDLWSRFFTALLLTAVVTLIGYTLNYAGGFGLGDVKLLVPISQILGFFSPWFVLFAITASLTTSAIFAIGRVLAKKLSWRDRIAFGPYLIFGYWLFALPLGISPEYF